eukprot:m.241125 g.241125  ORF g.241125 m.241125 type:complete len:51 (+) comp18045_c0_seq1:150-302(+)
MSGQAVKGIGEILNNRTVAGRRNLVFAVVAGWYTVFKIATAGGNNEEAEK